MNSFIPLEFNLSALRWQQLPPDQGVDIAFAGRSNAGKSTAINKITGIKGLAHTSKTPGRTQCLNFFTLVQNDQCRIVDLPGYGYAKVAHYVKASWHALLERYLTQRNALKVLVLLMDIRHPLKKIDQELLEFSQHRSYSVYILLTKADKLSKTQAQTSLNQVKYKLSGFKNILDIQLFSALHNLGVETIRQNLIRWLDQSI